MRALLFPYFAVRSGACQEKLDFRLPCHPPSQLSLPLIIHRSDDLPLGDDHKRAAVLCNHLLLFNPKDV
jgi:hypothetical protein